MDLFIPLDRLNKIKTITLTYNEKEYLNSISLDILMTVFKIFNRNINNNPIDNLDNYINKEWCNDHFYYNVNEIKEYNYNVKKVMNEVKLRVGYYKLAKYLF